MRKSFFAVSKAVVAVLATTSISFAALADGGAKFLGNITTSSQVRSDMGTYWNQLTNENGCKWGTIHSVDNSGKSKFNFNGFDSCENGYIGPDAITELLDAAGISQKQIRVVDQKQQALDFANEVGYPLVMKVVGPLHKSDVGGVTLNVKDIETVSKEFDRLMAIKDTYAVEMYPMLDGTEVYIGAIRDEKFGHQIFYGLGGIFIEVLKDVRSAIAPITKEEAKESLSKLRGYKILKGVRGQQAVNEDIYAEQVARVSALVKAAPEIVEMDINPLLGTPKAVVAVDARIKIQK